MNTVRQILETQGITDQADLETGEGYVVSPEKPEFYRLGIRKPNENQVEVAYLHYRSDGIRSIPEDVDEPYIQPRAVLNVSTWDEWTAEMYWSDTVKANDGSGRDGEIDVEGEDAQQSVDGWDTRLSNRGYLESAEEGRIQTLSEFKESSHKRLAGGVPGT
jgi:hypothetical protein